MVSSATPARRLLAPRARSGAVVDAAIALIALAGSLAQLLHHGAPFQTGPKALDLLSATLTVAATAPLAVWRAAPRAAFVASSSVTLLLGGLGYAIAPPLGPVVALYLLAASREERDPWTRRDSALAIALLGAYVLASAAGSDGPSAVLTLHTALAWAVAWFAGERTRLRREHIADLRERAARAERDGERERRLAAAEERARIARDLHDSVGHAINVIAVRAGAARLRHEQEPERSRAALEAIEDVARQTAEDIDQIVGALRDEAAGNGADPTPIGLASLPALVEEHSATGLAVTVRTSGQARPLAHAADQAAYRILQEALTNAARHGGGSARVELAFSATTLDLAVTNPAPHGAVPRGNGGHGLAGMRERAALLGGSLDACFAGGEFRLTARLPYAMRSR